MQSATQYSNKSVLYAEPVSSNSHGNHAKSVSTFDYPFSSCFIIGFHLVYPSMYLETVDKSQDSYTSESVQPVST